MCYTWRHSRPIAFKGASFHLSIFLFVFFALWSFRDVLMHAGIIISHSLIQISAKRPHIIHTCASVFRFRHGTDGGKLTFFLFTFCPADWWEKQKHEKTTRKIPLKTAETWWNYTYIHTGRKPCFNFLLKIKHTQNDLKGNRSHLNSSLDRLFVCVCVCACVSCRGGCYQHSSDDGWIIPLGPDMSHCTCVHSDQPLKTHLLDTFSTLRKSVSGLGLGRVSDGSASARPVHHPATAAWSCLINVPIECCTHSLHYLSSAGLVGNRAVINVGQQFLSL